MTTLTKKSLKRLRSFSCFSLNFFPLPGTGRLKNCIGYIICGEAIGKRRRRVLFPAYGLKKVRDLVDERVLIANLQARHPPVLHIRMIAVRNVHALPAAQAR